MSAHLTQRSTVLRVRHCASIVKHHPRRFEQFIGLRDQYIAILMSLLQRLRLKTSRPCVVVSPPEMHDYLRTVIVAPMTTWGRSAPFRISLSHGGKTGLILLDQIRAVEKVRLAKKMGSVSTKTLSVTLDTLQEVFSK